MKKLNNKCIFFYDEQCNKLYDDANGCNGYKTNKPKCCRYYKSRFVTYGNATFRKTKVANLSGLKNRTEI